MVKRERRERVEEAFIPPHIEKSRYNSKTRNIQENPGNSGRNPETLAFQGQHPKKLTP
jgi:hypothetical protein